MDDNEDPLGKISRQLSELAAAPNSSAVGAHPVSPASPTDGQWTPFSGISPQAGHPAFSNLYPWNPLDLPDFKPLTPLTQDISQNQFPTDSANPNVPRDFENQNQFGWQRGHLSPQQFQVASDLAGRLVDVSRNRTSTNRNDQQNLSFLGHAGFQPTDQVFHADRDSNNHIYRQMSQPSTSSPSPFTSSDRQSRLSVPSASSLSVSSPENAVRGDTRGSLPQDLSQDSLSHGLPVEKVPHSHLLHTPPLFDPSTPPPVFPLQRHQLEKQSGVPPTSAHDDIIDYLRMQNQASVNLDLGINIDRGNRHQFADLDNNFTSDEGRRMYESAMKQWHSFDSKNMSTADGSSTSPVQSSKQDSHSEQSASDSSKPSYSDIAKTPKTARSPANKIESPLGTDSNIRSTVPKPVKKDAKLLRPNVKRTASGSKFWPKSSLGGDGDQPRMSPTSRYGLDHFEDNVLGAGNHSSSSESLVQAAMSRRGSGSSASSSGCAVDDVPSQGAGGRTSVSESDTHGSGSSESKQTSYANTTKPPVSSKPQSASAPATSKESLFFDPRRIFQTKNTNKSRAQTSVGKSRGTTHGGLDDFGILPSSSNETILNNGKPTTTSSTSKLSSNARQHDYINNDLRDANKLTNQTAAESGQGMNTKTEEAQKHKESRSGSRRSGGRTNGLHRRDRRKSPDSDRALVDESNEDEAHHQRQQPGFLQEHIDTEKLEEWCGMAWEKFSHWGNLFITFLLNLLIYSLGLVLYLASGAVHLILLLGGKCWTLVKEKLLRRYFGSKEGTTWKSRDFLRRRVGLEENICLPSTGDEAMKRLLSCKGKDPYSILGLRADSTDEDIKKYYRKQAVLVHPDKNQEPGAEEAFKILGHAFEMIGEPTKRRQYDSHTQEANEADAMREFAEMLSKLQTKLQEAANIMRCDNCGDRHKRVPVDRPFYSARFCERCNTRHSAKEGDVWAESTMLGFLWHYYALMEGHVFDITDWMKCHKEYFKQMKANSHTVMYKIATDGNRRSKHHQSGEANLEDFINRLFKSSHAAGDGQGSSWRSHPGADSSWGQPPAGTTTTTSASKKGRRKKKRHQ